MVPPTLDDGVTDELGVIEVVPPTLDDGVTEREGLADTVTDMVAVVDGEELGVPGMADGLETGTELGAIHVTPITRAPAEESGWSTPNDRPAPP